ncbi:hypothetical protein QFC24_006744 [Naganishia onofrii]|uniref:Uncharacterized protein n=1 Tax=Naganishia onofrii TaxID=1851511 RepID=A0ACC2WYN7_9TREE|nr:hypothetical protein QFC24_006744 [Naganishia onofrii]
MRIPAVQDYLKDRLPKVERWLGYGGYFYRRIVYLAAAHDTTPIDAGIERIPPTRDDRIQSKTESLKGTAYMAMEYVPLICTNYEQRGDKWVQIQGLR